MKEELTKQLDTLIAFIEDTTHYFALFGKVIDSCAVARELNRIVWGEGLIPDEKFRCNSERIAECKKLAIQTHADWTIRYLENSKTEHTRKSIVRTIYNDIYQLALLK